MKRFFLSIIILFIIYIFSGFLFLKPLFVNLLSGREEKVLEDTIVLYNKIFTDLYASDGKTMRLDDFPASVLLKHELYRDLDFLRARGLLLVYDMASITFVKIKKTSPFTAEIDVFEEWNYVYQKNPSREIASEMKGMGQGFRYFLKKQKDRWTVLDSVPLDMKEPEKEDIIYF